MPTTAGRLRRACSGAVLLVALALAPAARAATGGYPYWNYDGPGSNASTYTWTDAHGNGFSPYGYAYRNCTDYVAWKLSTANGFGDYRGLGNASSWASAARARGYAVNQVPARGAVAWWGSELFGGFGHVAWVVNVDVGSVELAEYNHAGTGRFDLRTIPTGRADAYIHFEDLPVRLREGDFISARGAGGDYRLVGGAPVYVSDWSRFGGPHRVLSISRRRFGRLRPYPANGTFVTAAGHPYRVAGGAPIAIGSWARIGGREAATRIDVAALDRAGGSGRWSHLRSFPRVHTVLRAGPSGHLFTVRAGVPDPIAAVSSHRTPVIVDPAAIARAGEPGIWRFLR